MAQFFFRSGNLKQLLTFNQFSIMLRWAAIFFIIAIVAAIFGFGGIAAGAASIAKVFFYIFVVLWLLAIILGVTIFKKK